MYLCSLLSQLGLPTQSSALPAERSGHAGSPEQTWPQYTPGTGRARDAASTLEKQTENRSEVLLHTDLPKILLSMLTLPQTTTPGWIKQHLSSNSWISSTAEIPEHTQVLLDCPSQHQEKITYSHLLPPQAAPVLTAAVSSPSPRA